nr:MAG TPA: protein of unknown function (DUF1936) [Caudoviricetes sp.]
MWRCTNEYCNLHRAADSLQKLSILWMALGGETRTN